MLPASVSSPRRPSLADYSGAIKAAKLGPTDRAILQQLAKGLAPSDSMERSLDDKWLWEGAGISRRCFYDHLPALAAAGWFVKVGRRKGARRTNSLYRAMIPRPVAPAAPPAPEPVELMDAIVVQLAAARVDVEVSTPPAAPVAPVVDGWADPLASYPVLLAAALDVFGASAGTLGAAPGAGCTRSSPPSTPSCVVVTRTGCSVTSGTPSWRRSALRRSDTAWAHRRPRAAGAGRCRSGPHLDDDQGTYYRLKAAQAKPTFDIFAGRKPFRQVRAA